MSLRLVMTGSSSGIGQVLADRLAMAGHAVWGLSRHAPPAPLPANVRHTVCDVSDWSRLEEAARQVAAEWDSVDGLLCCAGVQGAVGPSMTLDPARWSETVRANLDGTFYSVRAFFPLLTRPGVRRGKIVCFSGGGATGPRPNFSAYGVAKAGIVRLVETLAHEWSGLPLDINAVAPGALPTRLTEETRALGAEQVGAAEYAAALKTAALGPAAFEKVVGLVESLLSAGSDGVTGRLLSAPWDPWPSLTRHREELAASDIFTLRRITPEDRGKHWPAD